MRSAGNPAGGIQRRLGETSSAALCSLAWPSGCWEVSVGERGPGESNGTGAEEIRRCAWCEAENLVLPAGGPAVVPDLADRLRQGGRAFFRTEVAAYEAARRVKGFTILLFLVYLPVGALVSVLLHNLLIRLAAMLGAALS